MIPSTLLSKLHRAISIALNVAAVSVVKYGLPVPAPKITHLPFF